MARVYNFSAGPSTLPEPVLNKAAAELFEYGSSGQSVMEMSHRTPVYEAIIADCEKNLREVMNIPDNYKVLFIQGGASMQFSAVALNLLPTDGKAGYIVSGQFSGKAYQEAKRLGNAVELASSKDKNFAYVPEVTSVPQDLAYVHICENNTIYGTKFPKLPGVGNVPLVADLSSCILSEPIDVSKYAVIYAGVQKNMGPAGMAVVIAREDMVGHAQKDTPVMLDWATYAENESMYNTPPTYTVYVVNLVLEWLKNEIGGLAKMKERNEKKAAILYNYLDNESKLFKATAEQGSRSMMNVCFVTGDADKDKDFAKKADAAGFVNLKGHRSVGGMRASIYNAMPVEGVEKLVAFMREYEGLK
jgi:phosphoserine aminotransferase